MAERYLFFLTFTLTLYDTFDMRLIHRFLIIGLIPLLCACRSAKENYPGISKLDKALSDKAVYESYFNDGVKTLKDVLAEQTDAEQKYNIRLRIADSYKVNSLDSTLFYLREGRKTAAALKSRTRIAKADFLMATAYIKAGYQVEADDILKNYRDTQIPDEVFKDYCLAEHSYWGETMAYSSTAESYKHKLAQRDKYRVLLMPMVKEASWEWYNLKREEADEASDNKAFEEYSLGMLKTSKENSREYAEAAYYYAHAKHRNGDEEGYEEWLLRSCIADIMCATKDYASLNEIARLIFNQGDIDRAFRYAADHCMMDALRYNGKLRIWQIMSFFPEIENAYQEKHTLQSKYTSSLLACITALLILTLLLLAFLYKRQQTLSSTRAELQKSYDEIDRRNHELMDVNSRLTALNARIQESDKVKQEYITQFLEIVSDNINASRQYRNRVLKYIRQGKTKELTDEIENQAPIDDDILEFHKMFDQTFVNIYPDFVEKFNALLAEGEEIVPKGDDILTPELRIFALIKLGISESSRIASLLHYSANTIYNYRAKIKNKARGSRDGFEDAVRNIE